MQSWQSVSVVATLKEISILNTNLLLSSIYVHVLVGFVVTFSRSGTYQFYLFVVRPYSPEKILSWTHLLGKRKGMRVYRNAVNVGHVEVVLLVVY